MNALDSFFWRAAERGSALIRDTARSFDGGDREAHLIRACYGADGVADHVLDDIRLIITDDWTARLISEGVALASALRYSRPDYAAMMDEAAAEKPALAPPGQLRAPTHIKVVSALLWRTVAEITPCLSGNPKEDDGHKLLHAIPERVVDSLKLMFGEDTLACQALGVAIVQEATDYAIRQDVLTRRPWDPVLAPNIADVATRAAISLADKMAAAETVTSMTPEQFEVWVSGPPSSRLCAVLELAHSDSAVALQAAYALLLMAASKEMLAAQHAASRAADAARGEATP